VNNLIIGDLTYPVKIKLIEEAPWSLVTLPSGLEVCKEGYSNQTFNNEKDLIKEIKPIFKWVETKEVKGKIKKKEVKKKVEDTLTEEEINDILEEGSNDAFDKGHDLRIDKEEIDLDEIAEIEPNK